MAVDLRIWLCLWNSCLFLTAFVVFVITSIVPVAVISPVVVVVVVPVVTASIPVSSLWSSGSESTGLRSESASTSGYFGVKTT